MKVRIIFCSIIAMILLSCLLASACAAPAPTPAPAPAPAPEPEKMQPVTLKFGSPYPSPDLGLMNDGARVWMEMVTERTDGAITFETYYGGSLGTGAEIYELLQVGEIDVTLNGRPYQAAKWPLCMIAVVFPFGPSDAGIVNEAMRQIRREFPQVDQDTDKANLVQIARTAQPRLTIISKIPITKLEDMQGKKIGSIGRYLGAWSEAAGLTPVVCIGQARYEMLRTGVIDMSWLPDNHNYEFKHHEVADYVIDAGGPAACHWGLDMNKDVFNSFDSEVQRILIDAGYMTEDIQAHVLIPHWLYKVIYPYWDQIGIKRTKLPDDEREEWVREVEDIPALWAKELTDTGYPGEDIVRRWQEITTDLGFTWDREWGK